MSRKYLYKKITILFTLIFSFLFCLIPASKVSAATTTNQDYVKLTSITREDNLIKFTTDSVYTVDSITYEITHYGTATEIYADLVTDAEVNKINDYMYSFEVSDEVIGVKIWKLKYQVSTDYFKNKMTTGKNTIGNVDAVHRKNYVEVTTDLLWSSNGEGCEAGFFENKTCRKYYVFYFNLDTEIDWIVNLSMEYSIQTVEKSSWFSKETTNTKSYEIKLDHTTDVYDIEKGNKYLIDYMTTHDNISFEQWVNQMDYVYATYRRQVLGANTNENGYDWYVQPLIEQELTEEEYFANWGYKREYLQEVAIVKMSYYSNGQYFEDIPVQDEDTGWIEYSPDSNTFFDKIDWLNTILTIVAIIVVLIIINFLLHAFKLDKESREKRRFKKEMRELREEQIRILKDQNNSYYSNMKNSNSKYNDIKRYKK